MPTYIALLRGINVGGKNSLPMKEFVAMLEDIGADKVKTYIQSGNGVFQHKKANPAELAKQVSAAIKKGRGFEPHVLVLELAELKKALDENPFPEAESDPASLHFGFLAAKPKQPNLDKLTNLKSPTERFHLSESVFYLHAPDGIGRSKLAASSEKLLGVPMTDRNWRTVSMLVELAGG